MALYNQHEPTPEQRHIVQLHATIGTPQDDIAKVIGIDPKTLRLHYRDELDLASAKANAVVGGALFNKAKAGDTTAMIFWMKTRAGWKETHGVEHSGSVDHKHSARNMTDDELAAYLRNDTDQG